MTIRYRVMTKDDGWVHNAARSFRYPGGELHLKDIVDRGNGIGDVWVADVRFEGLDDLGYAAMFSNVADRRGGMPFVLFLPYFPGARSDHEDSPDPLGVEVYSDFISAMAPDQVITIDPHSDVCENYCWDLTVLDPTPLVVRALTHPDGKNPAVRPGDLTGIIAPDKGAVGRASKVAEALDLPLHTADKHRDFDSGKILELVPPELDPEGHYLVVDDICDGGGTFKMLADALGLPSHHLSLWVTHGIFSGTATGLRQYYHRIYTTDSHPGHNKVGIATSIVPVEVYMTQNMKEF